jgi:chitinase
MISLDLIDMEYFQSFVARAHAEQVGAFLSIGGWTGSLYYSSLVEPSNQDAFVGAIVDVVNNYTLDGIEFDWEYPNKQGIGCNQISPNDTANFLSFLQKLRADPVGSNLTLSAAVGITPWNGPDGTPMTNVSEFSNYLDYINVMNYDVWGSWSATAGPNAPLNDSCAPPAMQQGSAVSAVKAWTGAGFPANQIVLGVPAYAHSFSVSQSAAAPNGSLALYPTFNNAMQPAGEGETANTTSTDECGNTVSGYSGVWNFEGLISSGFLQNNNGTVNPGPGMMYTFDNCSQTPFLYDPNTQVLISYDNAQSFAAKGQFINDNGLAGFAMWHVAGDSSTHTLIDAISSAMNIVRTCN